jgi:hypothetical protein
MFSRRYASHAANRKNKAGIKTPYIDRLAGNFTQLTSKHGRAVCRRSRYHSKCLLLS